MSREIFDVAIPMNGWPQPVFVAETREQLEQGAIDLAKRLEHRDRRRSVEPGSCRKHEVSVVTVLSEEKLREAFEP
jgi:hypothetical protein